MVSYDKESILSDGTEREIIPAWTLQPIEHAWASMSPTSDLLERFHPFDSDDMIEAGIRMVCAARQISGTPTDGGIGAGVGAYVQVATIDARGISSWIAHRWPDDVIGRPVDPALGDPLPAWIAEKDRNDGPVQA